LITSCSFFNHDDPKTVTQKFVTAFKSRNYEEAVNYATSESQPYLEKLAEETGEQVEPPDYSKSFSFTLINIIGDTAIVKMTAADKKIDVDFTLVKETGAWRVVFDKETILKMVLGAHANKDIQTRPDANSIEDIQRGIDSINKELDDK
jgi:hypothetical protein